MVTEPLTMSTDELIEHHRQELRRLGGVVGHQRRLVRRGTHTSGDPNTRLAAMRAQLLDDLQGMVDRCRKALRSKTKMTAQDHKALASTLIALSERVDAMLASRSSLTAETYEERLARAYKAQGLPLPGRLAAALGRAPEPAEPAEPTPPTFPARDVALRSVTPSFGEEVSGTGIDKEDKPL